MEGRCQYSWDNNLCFSCRKAGHGKRQCRMNIWYGKSGTCHNTVLRLDNQDPQLVSLKCVLDSSDIILIAVAKVSGAEATLVSIFFCSKMLHTMCRMPSAKKIIYTICISTQELPYLDGYYIVNTTHDIFG